MLVKIKNTAELGALTKAVRKSENIRQDDVADMIDRSHVYIRDIENGKSKPNIGGILDLFEELGIQIHLDVPLSSDRVKQVLSTLNKKDSKK
ncbi:helix-turn-helix domain-containing protein [Alkalimarinus coralli]|uniref:helix-turn-helix domain-containing protein n=1 Tax=Alkalimarinus coralli TaxID=2935863 RepID=UPI00202B66B2|nr:helix-turn-helix domain-containing protein [Alkalimarinus coralli]